MRAAGAHPLPTSTAMRERKEHRRIRAAIGAALAGLALGGCMSLDPEMPVADATIPAQWPLPPTTDGAVQAERPAGVATGTRAVVDGGGRALFVDGSLARPIELAIANGRILIDV